MNIERLKFAWVRGARIQFRNLRPRRGVWIDSPCPRWFPYHGYRIHPDDEHLQYGPLSSALREYACAPPERKNNYFKWNREQARMLQAAITACMALLDLDCMQATDFDYLLLAEMLADEGL